MATYNVHKCVGSDRKKDPARVAAVIRELEADMVGLQEVDNRSGGTHESAQMDFLAMETGYEAISGATIKLPDGYYGNVLLTRWPVVQKRELDLCFTRREPRGAIEAVLSVNRREVRVIVTHLGLAGEERRYQIGQLVECLAEKRPPPVTVLLGDINEWFPLSSRLREIDRALGRSPVLRSFPSRRPFLSLDRIWVKPGAAMKAIRVHSTRLSRAASDHLPVVAEIQLGEP